MIRKYEYNYYFFYHRCFNFDYSCLICCTSTRILRFSFLFWHYWLVFYFVNFCIRINNCMLGFNNIFWILVSLILSFKYQGWHSTFRITILVLCVSGKPTLLAMLCRANVYFPRFKCAFVNKIKNWNPII